MRKHILMKLRDLRWELVEIKGLYKLLLITNHGVEFEDYPIFHFHGANSYVEYRNPHAIPDYIKDKVLDKMYKGYKYSVVNQSKG